MHSRIGVVKSLSRKQSQMRQSFVHAIILTDADSDANGTACLCGLPAQVCSVL